MFYCCQQHSFPFFPSFLVHLAMHGNYLCLPLFGVGFLTTLHGLEFLHFSCLTSSYSALSWSGIRPFLHVSMYQKEQELWPISLPYKPRFPLKDCVNFLISISCQVIFSPYPIRLLPFRPVLISIPRQYQLCLEWGKRFPLPLSGQWFSITLFSFLIGDWINHSNNMNTDDLW